VHITHGIGGSAMEHAATSCLWANCTPRRGRARAIHHGFLRLVVRPNAITAEAVCGPRRLARTTLRCGQDHRPDRDPGGRGTDSAKPQRQAAGPPFR
jgi:hypothetical protein